MKVLIIFLGMIVLISSVSTTCEDTYFFVIQNNWNFSSDDLNQSGIKKNYIDNYEYFCVNSEYPILPDRPIKKIIFDQRSNKCEMNEGYLRKFSIEFPDINFENITCSTARKVNYFFDVQENSNYSIKKVRLWFILSLFFAMISIPLIISNSKLNKLIEKRFKNNEGI